MRIQVNTDRSVQGSAALNEHVETELGNVFGRFGNQITRIEVHLSDVDGPKGKGDDKNCLLEARLAGRQPIVVNHQGPTIDAAIDGAAQKMEKSLNNLLGRLRQRKGRTPFGGDE